MKDYTSLYSFTRAILTEDGIVQEGDETSAVRCCIFLLSNFGGRTQSSEAICCNYGASNEHPDGRYPQWSIFAVSPMVLMTYTGCFLAALDVFLVCLYKGYHAGRDVV